MEPAHPVAVVGQAQPENRHRHFRGVIAFSNRNAPADHTVKVKLRLLCKRRKIRTQQPDVEHLVARRHRRMRGEDIRTPDDLQRHIGIVPEIVDQVGDPAQRKETGMALVHVADRRGIPHRQQRLESADSQQKFLMQPHALVAAVETPGHFAKFGRILRDLRIEQNQRHIADPEHPGRRVKLAVNQRNADDDLLALRITGADQRKIVDFRNRIVFRLPAIAVQHLPEIPLPVEQSDRDQRKFKIAGRLQMVAGENTEAAGEDPNALMNAEFQRKYATVRLVTSSVLSVSRSNSWCTVRSSRR